jgi:cell shape-determining protein MreC
VFSLSISPTTGRNISRSLSLLAMLSVGVIAFDFFKSIFYEIRKTLFNTSCWFLYRAALSPKEQVNVFMQFSSAQANYQPANQRTNGW